MPRTSTLDWIFTSFTAVKWQVYDTTLFTM